MVDFVTGGFTYWIVYNSCKIPATLSAENGSEVHISRIRPTSPTKNSEFLPRANLCRIPRPCAFAENVLGAWPPTWSTVSTNYFPVWDGLALRNLEPSVQRPMPPAPALLPMMMRKRKMSNSLLNKEMG